MALNIEEIKNIMEKVRDEHFKKKDLMDGGKIFYVNGKEGTDYCFRKNGSSGIFTVYDKNETCVISGALYYDNKFEVWISNKDDKKKPTSLSFDTNLDLQEVADYLLVNLDDKEIYDSPMESWILKEEPSKLFSYKARSGFYDKLMDFIEKEMSEEVEEG